MGGAFSLGRRGAVAVAAAGLAAAVAVVIMTLPANGSPRGEAPGEPLLTLEATGGETVVARLVDPAGAGVAGARIVFAFVGEGSMEIEDPAGPLACVTSAEGECRLSVRATGQEAALLMASGAGISASLEIAP
ncbi:MAG: hypothetical protein ACRDY7_03615 [Acidimicrobiia bacterium]